MAIREIRKKGDEILYKKCKEVKNFDMKIFLAFLTVIHQEGIEDLLNKSRLDCFELEEE